MPTSEPLLFLNKITEHMYILIKVVVSDVNVTRSIIAYNIIFRLLLIFC